MYSPYIMIFYISMLLLNSIIYHSLKRERCKLTHHGENVVKHSEAISDSPPRIYSQLLFVFNGYFNLKKQDENDYK